MAIYDNLNTEDKEDIQICFEDTLSLVEELASLLAEHGYKKNVEQIDTILTELQEIHSRIEDDKYE